MKKQFVIRFYYISSLLLLIAAVILTPIVFKDYIDFLKNYVKKDCVLVDFETQRSHKRRRGIVTEYKCFYLYVDDNNIEYIVKPKSVTEKKPAVGEVKSIYLNPNNPTIYYTSSIHALFSFISFPSILLLGSYCMMNEGKKRKEKLAN